MTKRLIAPALATLLLAGCNQTSQTNSVAEPANASDQAGNASGPNAADAVIALSERQRNATFIRAILDAGLKCEAVTKSERLPDQGKQPSWRADCGPNNSHIITIGRDGTATINSRAD